MTASTKPETARPTPGPAPAAAVPVTPPAAKAVKRGKDAAPSIGELVAEASKQASTLVHSEIELAKLELKSTFTNALTGGVAFAAAAVVLVFALVFGFIALAEGIHAAGLYRWASYLIVFGFQLLIVGVAVFLGIRKIKRVKAPQRTISTGKETVAYLRKHG